MCEQNYTMFWINSDEIWKVSVLWDFKWVTVIRFCTSTQDKDRHGVIFEPPTKAAMWPKATKFGMVIQLQEEKVFWDMPPKGWGHQAAQKKICFPLCL